MDEEKKRNPKSIFMIILLCVLCSFAVVTAGLYLLSPFFQSETPEIIDDIRDSNMQYADVDRSGRDPVFRYNTSPEWLSSLTYVAKELSCTEEQASTLMESLYDVIHNDWGSSYQWIDKIWVIRDDVYGIVTGNRIGVQCKLNTDYTVADVEPMKYEEETGTWLEKKT